MDQSCTVRSSRKAVIAMFILATALLHVGCLAAPWVVAVTVDSMRAGDVRFQPFEESWVSTENVRAIVDRPSLNSLAFMPVDGDDLMGARLTKILKEKTSLRVVTPVRQPAPLSMAGRTQDHVVMARQLSREFAVDAVLYGHVVGSGSHSSEWGGKAEESRRLFLYMIDRDGHLLWRDELPFLIVTGTKPALEESVQLSLTRHFMDHVHALGLDDAGYFPSKSS
jgi:hypothetical protein